MKAILHDGADGQELVFLNISGGLTSGYHPRFPLAVRSCAVAITQTAERADKVIGVSARMAVRLDVGPGGWFDCLPQATILFDRAALDRRTVIDPAPGAGCLALGSSALGGSAAVRRLAMRGLSGPSS